MRECENKNKPTRHLSLHSRLRAASATASKAARTAAPVVALVEAADEAEWEGLDSFLLSEHEMI